MSIGVLKTGSAPAPLRERHGDMDAMFVAMLRSGGWRGDIAIYDVAAREWPASADAHQGFVITGSAAGVYEPHDWVPPLLDFVRTAHRGAIPQIGVCFGHQAMATALGGKVEKSAKGWGAGRHDYDVIERRGWFEDGAPSFSVAAMHQDQVVEKPDGAEVLAGNTFCPNGVLDYGARSLSIQLHPEFTHAYAEDLLRHCVGRRFDAAFAELAIASLRRGPLDSPQFAPRFVEFLTAPDR